MLEKRPELACPKFEESARIVQLGGTLLNLADCYESQGRLATAWSTFIASATVAHRAGNLAREQEARERTAILEPKLPKLTIQVTGAANIPGLEIRRDDTTVGGGQFGAAIPIDPGSHRVVATAPDRQTWETNFEIKPGQLVTIAIPTLEPASRALPARSAEPLAAESAPPKSRAIAPAPRNPTPDHSASKTPLIIATSVFTLGLATSGVFGLLSLKKHNLADDHCDGGQCRDKTGVALRQSARTYGDISTGAFVVGAVGAAVGVTFWLTSEKTETSAQARAAFTVGPGNVQLSGTF
jgi:hypothetical protein